MSAHIDYQIIKKNGHPEFAILPFEQMQYLLRCVQDTENEDVTIPDEVVRLVVVEQNSPMRAWRLYLQLTQTEVAERLSVTQPIVARMEKKFKLNPKTAKRVALALNIKIAQLDI